MLHLITRALAFRLGKFHGVRISNTARVAARVAARVPPAGPGAVRDSPSDRWWGRVGVARRHGRIIDGGWNRWMNSPNAAPIMTASSSVAPFKGMSGGHGSRVVQQRFRGCPHKGMRRNAGPSSCALKLIGTSHPRRQCENRCR